MSEITESTESHEKNESPLQNQSLSKMASVVLHEIHMPLGAIMNHANSLGKIFEKMKNESAGLSLLAEGSRHAMGIEDIAGMLLKMVKGLTKIEQEKPGDAFVLTAIGDIVRSSIEVSKPFFSKSGVSFFFDQGQILEFPIECRPYEIVQVLLNLMRNGVEAVEDLPERWVRLEMKKKGIYIYFRVIDSGLGIRNEIVEKIFEPFFTTKAQKENGVGLYISKKIIQNHGGELLYEKAGDHTSFVIKLPILQGGRVI